MNCVIFYLSSLDKSQIRQNKKMNENYASAAGNLSCLFPSIEEIHRFEYEGSGLERKVSNGLIPDSAGITCYFEKFYAIAEGNALTIFELAEEDGESSSNIIAEIEFDNPLTLMQWDVSGQCLALSDDHGVIHLVKQSGTLLFSKQVFSGNLVRSPKFRLLLISVFAHSDDRSSYSRIAVHWRESLLAVIVRCPFQWKFSCD